jgi:hypothetical protein
MKIIYHQKTLMEVCEVTLNRMYATEPGQFERVILEDHEKVMVSSGRIYLKKDLEIKK